MKLTHDEWTLDHLKVHLQYAVDLEFWTIPFYMSAMYSIKDRSDPAFQLIRTVVNQEMLHMQCAANMANAFGLSPTVEAPTYEGTTIPHLDFGLDDPKVIAPYLPYTAEIGPLDLEHINAMCLIEIPDYDTGEKQVELYAGTEEYGSIGAFYEALRLGASLLKENIRGGVQQVDAFAPFYNNMPQMVVSESRSDGLNQVILLIELITEQGEGQSKTDTSIPSVFQNTADDMSPDDDHFEKFNMIKDSAKGKGKLPATYIGKPRGKYTAEDKKVEAILIEQFTELRGALKGLFGGKNPENFFPVMASVGGSIRNCWKHGVTPKFS